jgi:hypothetical protein
VRGQRLGDEPRELVPIDRECRACGHAAGLCGAHHERAETPHFFLQQTDGVVELVAAEGVAADELSKPIGLVDRRRAHGPHFVEGDGDAP